MVTVHYFVFIYSFILLLVYYYYFCVKFFGDHIMSVENNRLYLK